MAASVLDHHQCLSSTVHDQIPAFIYKLTPEKFSTAPDVAELPDQKASADHHYHGSTDHVLDLHDHERLMINKPASISVPVISLNNPIDQSVVEETRAACREWGIFLITDHGIPLSLIDKFMDAGRQCFEMPKEELEKLENDPANGVIEGYGTKMVSNKPTDSKLEWINYFFHIIQPASMVNHAKWPQHPPNYMEVAVEYCKEVKRVVNVILEVLSRGLELEEKAIKEALGDEELVMEMKINHYPRCPQPDMALGVEAHTDMSGMTVLVADRKDGLEVWKDEKWMAVDYLPGSLVVHIGDQLEILSNKMYKSVLHRSQVSKEDARTSCPIFIAPPSDKVIGPLPQLLGEDKPPLFGAMSYKEFKNKKLNNLLQNMATSTSSSS